MSSSRKKGRSWLSNEDESAEVEEELLVFGYSCKLFRDDEKATFVDEGRHLIPWMGNENLMIDRYDGRGHLHDLGPYEANDGSVDLWDQLSEEEKHMERVCDEERYLGLNKNMAEEELYHEEELKRLRAALAEDGHYNQVSFSYDESSKGDETVIVDGTAENSNIQSSNEVTLEEVEEEEEDKLFVPKAELCVPDGMEVPSSAKINVIVEKTALFVSKHGPQMEIVIKAKQANNPQFGFLAFDHSLNPYYKHMVAFIKSGKFVPSTQPSNDHSANQSDDDEDGSDDDHYLHPSLLSAKKPSYSPLSILQKIPFVHTGDTSYSLLVSQLKDKVQPVVHESIPLTAIGSSFQHMSSASPKVDSNLPPPPGLVPVTLPSVVIEVDEGEKDLLKPPPDLMAIIDKMATYVAKNGEDFEVVVKNKGSDSRFEFLQFGHQFYPYYQYKKRMYEKKMEQQRVNQSDPIEDDSKNALDKEKTGVVSFSIKMKESGSEKRNALNDAENSEGELKQTATDGTDIKDGSLTSSNQENTEMEKLAKVESQGAKLAEERIRDRLAAAARERMVQVSREKQLQMERKRKAALFLNLLQKGKEEDVNMIGPKLPTPAELEAIVNGEGDLPLVPQTLHSTLIRAVIPPPTISVVTTLATPAVASVSMVNTITPAYERKVAMAVDRLMAALPTGQLLADAIGDTKVSGGARSIGSPSNRRTTRQRSRSRSSYRRRRSRSRSRDRRRRQKKTSRSRSRRRSRSSSHSPEDRDRRKRKRDKDRRRNSKTPPAAYSRSRGSSSPHRFRSKSSSRRSSRYSRSKDEIGRRSSSSSPRNRRRNGTSSHAYSSSKNDDSSSSRSKKRCRSGSTSRSSSPTVTTKTNNKTCKA